MVNSAADHQLNEIAVAWQDGPRIGQCHPHGATIEIAFLVRPFVGNVRAKWEMVV